MSNIYLDNAATTRASDAVMTEMARAEHDLYFNSSALYSASLHVKQEINRAKTLIAKRLTGGTGTGELIFTSGATEGNNMVIFGKITHKRNHLLVLAGEHSSVYAPSVYLKNQGFDVDYVPLNKDGTADINALKRLIRPNTALFVFGMVNSDTGCIQDARAIVSTIRALNKATHIHCDATQAFCKFNFDANALDLDSCTVSAHKINGPKGIGALWVKRSQSLHPIMYGGGQQPLRPGTENNPAILGFAKAVETFNTDTSHAHIKKLHTQLVMGLPEGCTVNGKNDNPYITNIQLPMGILGQTVMNALSTQGIFVGLGSACASTASKNRTLLAMGIPEQKTKQVLRVSLGIFNTPADIEKFLEILKQTLHQLYGK